MKEKKVRILSIDGGGMRGIIPATILEHIETYLQAKRPGSQLADHFDLIAGTSTGGILAGLLLTPDPLNPTKPRFTAADALDFYAEQGYSIFNGSKYSNWRRIWGLQSAAVFNPKRIEQLLSERFGDLKISELIKPCVITTYNMQHKCAYFFTSREDTAKREFFLRDVLRSTSAAPTYFPPAIIQNIAPNAEEDHHPKQMVNLDGGVFANNPLMCAYAEARNTNFEDRGIQNPTAKDMYILSLGTGGGGFKLQGLQDSADWGLLKWAKSIPEIMMDGSIDTVAYQVREIFNTLERAHQQNYLRIDVPNASAYRDYAADMSDASPENVEKLKIAGQKTLAFAQNKGLDAFLDGLLDEDSSDENPGDEVV